MNLNDIAKKTLGDSTSYAVYTDKVDSTLLNPMPRSLARSDWGIDSNQFVGYDVWHAYEATFLNEKGRPISGILKLVYSSESEFIVESKSLKLYLNTFDMSRVKGNTDEEAGENYANRVSSDLSEILKVEVRTNFFNSEKLGDTELEFFNPLIDSINLDSLYTIKNMEITDYSSMENHLTSSSVIESDDCTYVHVHTNSLRSRCRHTKQKDSGVALLYQDSGNVVDILDFYKQIISLREVNEFHEFCAEKIFADIMKVTPDTETLIAFLYHRRGGIDINPIRATSLVLIPDYFIRTDVLTTTQYSG